MPATYSSLENLISQLSAKLSAGDPEELSSIIEEGMAEALTAIGAGRLCWYVCNEGSTRLQRIYSVSTVGNETVLNTVSDEQIPFTFDRLMQGKVVMLGGPEDLPPTATQDREFFNPIFPGNLILMPSNCGTRRKGVFGVAALSREVRQDDELLSQLSILNNLIVTTYERTIAHLRLQESEQRFRCIFQEAPIGIALEDSDGKILFVNPAMCAILGYTEDELRGMHCDEFSAPEGQTDESVLFQKLQQGIIRRYDIDKQFVRKGGNNIWGRVEVALLRNEEGPPLVIGMLEDITEQKLAEQELKATRSDLQKLAGYLIQAQDDERHRISRELHDDIGQRASLLAVELDRLSQSLAASGQRDALQQVQVLKSQAEDLTRDLNVMSHELHSAKLQHLGLRAALEDLVKNLAKQHKIKLELNRFDVGRSLPSDVELCFYRVAQEALNNVVHHSKASYASVEVSCAQGFARLQIKDTGVGFDTSRSGKGIGLVSMRERMRVIGGDFSVDSIQGKGTHVNAEVVIA
jgi:PAS domain S-box-containing protein